MVAIVMVNANFDVAINGFMWEACTQFDIARHRLEELPRRLRQAIVDGKTPKEMLMRIERESLELAALHHNHIIECSFIRFFNSYKVARCKSATHIYLNIFSYFTSVNMHESYRFVKMLAVRLENTLQEILKIICKSMLLNESFLMRWDRKNVK